MNDIKKLTPIPVGDWTEYVVYATRDDHLSVDWNFETHQLVGWGIDKYGRTVPVYWNGWRLSSCVELGAHHPVGGMDEPSGCFNCGYSNEGDPCLRCVRGVAWVVLPRGEEPDWVALETRADADLREQEAFERKRANHLDAVPAT